MAEKLTLPADFTLVDEKWFFPLAFLLVGENKFFTFGANIQVTLIVIDKLIFVKGCLLFATGLGLVIAVRDINFYRAIFQLLEIFSGTIARIGTAGINFIGCVLLGLIDHRY